MTVLRRQAPGLLVLLVALGYLAVTDSNAAISRASTVGVYGLIALSVGLGWGQVGILSLAQAQLAAIGAYATAITVTRWGWPVELAILPALAIPFLVALVVGRLVVRLSPLALAIATLIVARLVIVMINNGGDFTGTYIGLSGIDRVWFVDSNERFTVFIWVCVAIVLWAYANLVDSTVGRAMQTVRHDEVRAEADGINVVRLRTITFALTGAIAGLAGWLYVQFISYIAPESLSVNVAITAVLMAVVGGARSVIGPIVGAALLTVAGDYLPSENVRGLFYGGTLIVMLMVAPVGIAGMVSISRRKGGWASRLLPRRLPDATAPAVPAESGGSG